MTRRKMLRWVFLGLGATVIALFKKQYIPEAQAGNPMPIAGSERVTESRGSALPLGRLEGAVTLGCASPATDCVERPYQIGLLLRNAQGQQKPQVVDVSDSGAFSISLPPGTYTLSSADVRGACCLPILQPMTVIIMPGQTIHVNVRFQPGLQLPTR
jgi:hypothetical protein